MSSGRVSIERNSSISPYQPVLFGGASFGELEDVVGGFFATVDDDTPTRMGMAAVA
jgi:phenylalanine-4-hydroxylase